MFPIIERVTFYNIPQTISYVSLVLNLKEHVIFIKKKNLFHSLTFSYGLPGGTDSEGFNPYADTVGPGIYGGSVKRDENGNVVIGKQYQNRKFRIITCHDICVK